MNHWKNNNVVCLLDYGLVAEKTQCTGSERNAGFMPSSYACYEQCKGEATMFVYASDPSRCTRANSRSYCACFCETSSKIGKCTHVYHSQFNLYAVGEYFMVEQQGKIVISLHFFVTFKTFWDTINHIDQFCEYWCKFCFALVSNDEKYTWQMKRHLGYTLVYCSRFWFRCHGFCP